MPSSLKPDVPRASRNRWYRASALVMAMAMLASGLVAAGAPAAVAPTVDDVAWRGAWAGEQGGAILGHAIHIHDWLTMALGPVASVVAEVDTRVNDIEIEDCAALAIRMASGALVTSSVTLGAADDTSRLRLCFEGFTAESGSVPYAPADGTWRFTAREPFEQAAIDRVLAGVSPQRSGFAGFFEAVADALDGRPGREVTLDDGWRSLAFVTAVYASARSGRRETLPQTTDHPLYASWLP